MSKNYYTEEKAIMSIQFNETQYSEDTDKQKMLALIDFVETFECICPELLRFAHSCGTIWNAISTSKRISSRYKDIQNFHKMITYYKGIGWFDNISIEYKRDYTSKIGITIRMCVRSVEDHIKTITINQPLYDSSIEYKNAFTKANYDMMIKYNLGSSWKDAINVIANYIEDLGETSKMVYKRYTLYRNTIIIIHTELWNSILTALGDSNMCFSDVDLRNNNLRTLPDNFKYINDNAVRVDLRDNNIDVLPCQDLGQCIVDWKTECLFSRKIQDDRRIWRTEHPINFAVIQNYCFFPVGFRRIQRTDGGEISRFVGQSYRIEVFSDEESMDMIINIHEDFLKHGRDINCHVVNMDRLVRDYKPSHQRLLEIETELRALSTDISDFVTR